MTRAVWILICAILQEGERQNQLLPHHMRCIKIIGSTQLSCDPCTGIYDELPEKQISNQEALGMNHRCDAGRSNRLDKLGHCNWRNGKYKKKMGNCFNALLKLHIKIQHRKVIH